MGFETIRLERDGRGVARLTLTRPERHNAMNAAMIGELMAAAGALAADPPRALVLAGEGASFCAGGDLSWMKAQFEADRAGKMAEARALAGMLRALDELPTLVIARVHGPAYGGGVGMIAVSDVAIGADGAKFALTETRLGLIPATIGPFVLRRIGEPAMRRHALNAGAFDAAEAARIGLLSAAVPAADLDAAVEREVALALAAAPGAIADAKRLIRDLAGRDPAVAELTAERLADRWETEEARAGIAAFFDKRKAPWAP
jgi:methylglutaconyl-CoA hydratase